MTATFDKRHGFPRKAGILVAMLLAFVSLGRVTGRAAESPAPAKRVLVLYSDERLLPSSIAVDEGLRRAFAAKREFPVEYLTEFLESV